MGKKYIVTLSGEEKRELLKLVKTGKSSARKIIHANILLQTNSDSVQKGKTDEEISEILHTSTLTIQRTRRRCVEEGIESAINRKPHRRTKPRRLDGEGEAKLVQLCCSEAPEGRSKWTLKLLADELIRLEIVPSIAPSTVGETLKKTNCIHGETKNGA